MLMNLCHILSIYLESIYLETVFVGRPPDLPLIREALRFAGLFTAPPTFPI